MAVDRCVCHRVPFTELKRLADDGLRTVDALSERTRCCTGCGMCEPYVRLMLKTGRTRFPVLSDAQIAAALAAPDPARSPDENTARENPGRG
ncbi:MAG: (2Fe-2S)-binding protein [Planctomycetota bacterium]